jgi:hypothetical protein
MLHHLFNLLAGAWGMLMQKTGTSTLGFALYGIGFTALGWVAAVLVRWWNHPRQRFVEAMYVERFLGLFIAVLVGALTGIAYIVALIGTVYSDHQSLVERAAPNALHCWMQNMVLPAVPSTVANARSASETVMYCNQERKAPLMVAIDYDATPIATGPVEFPAGRQVEMHQSLSDRRVFVQISSPSILPFQIFRVVVYGAGDTAPVATQIKITPIDPER